jgi:hypothetical protein
MTPRSGLIRKARGLRGTGNITPVLAITNKHSSGRLIAVVIRWCSNKKAAVAIRIAVAPTKMTQRQYFSGLMWHDI